MNYTYEYPRPSITADIIITDTLNNNILLIQRKNPPFQDMWALPGGFADEHETLENTASRELQEETGVNISRLKQFKTYSTPGRDPRGWTISTVFFGEANIKNMKEAAAGDDAKAIKWFPINELPKLAFDHQTILKEFTIFLTKTC